MQNIKVCGFLGKNITGRENRKCEVPEMAKSWHLRRPRWDILVVQWLRLCLFSAWDTGSIPGQGTKILQVMWHGQKIKISLKKKTKASSKMWVMGLCGHWPKHAKLLPNPSLCARRTVRPHKMKHQSLEQRKAYFRAKKRRVSGLCSKYPELLEGFQQSIFKAR